MQNAAEPLDCAAMSPESLHTPEILQPDDDAVARAATLLRAGGLVAFPTETVYGLGADATSDAAVAGIFAAKDRPQFNPLIVHFTDAEAAAREVVFDARARRVAEAFWPGPLTLVLPRRKDSRISLLCSAGLDSQAVRVPAHPLAHRLLSECGLPLAAPSANASGKISPTEAAHVAASLGAEGPAQGMDSQEPHLRNLLGFIGITDVTFIRAEKLAFGPEAPADAAAILNLSPAGDLTEAAAHLFAYLHRLDALEVRAIAVMPIPETGLGAAINDRLRRAAAPRG